MREQMSYKVFDVPTMVAVSAPWADDGKDKPLLESVPLTAGLVPILVTAHNQLLRIQVSPAAKETLMKTLIERALALDTAHDEKYRALYSILTGWAAVSGKERKAELETVRDTLFPDGLAGTQRTYLAESGSVELSVTKVTPEIESLLDSIVVDGKSMLDLFHEWSWVGRQLGDVERQRTRLAETDSEDAVTLKDIQNARYKWIRAVNALTALLDLDSDISKETKIRLLQPLFAAEAKFAKKKAQTTEPAAPAEDENSDVPTTP